MSASPINTRVVEFLEELLRSKKADSKAAIGEAMGFGRGTISEIMRFKQGATPEFIAKLVEVYEASADFLLTGKGSMLKGRDYPEAEASEPATEYAKKNPSVYDIADLDKRLRLIEIEVKSLDYNSDLHAKKIAGIESTVETVLRDFIKEHS